MREMCVLCIQSKREPCRMQNMEFCPRNKKSCWDDCKDKTPDDIIREIDYAVKHCPPPPDIMILEAMLAERPI